MVEPCDTCNVTCAKGSGSIKLSHEREKFLACDAYARISVSGTRARWAMTMQPGLHACDGPRGPSGVRSTSRSVAITIKSSSAARPPLLDEPRTVLKPHARSNVCSSPPSLLELTIPMAPQRANTYQMGSISPCQNATTPGAVGNVPSIRTVHVRARLRNSSDSSCAFTSGVLSFQTCSFQTCSFQTCFQ